jgi:hypothetical protein
MVVPVLSSLIATAQLDLNAAGASYCALLRRHAGNQFGARPSDRLTPLTLRRRVRDALPFVCTAATPDEV